MSSLVEVSDCSRRNAAALATALNSAIRAEPGDEVRVDLSHVTALDADGLCAVIAAAKTAASARKRLRLVAASAPVRRRLEVLGLDVALGDRPVSG